MYSPTRKQRKALAAGAEAMFRIARRFGFASEPRLAAAFKHERRERRFSWIANGLMCQAFMDGFTQADGSQIHLWTMSRGLAEAHLLGAFTWSQVVKFGTVVPPQPGVVSLIKEAANVWACRARHPIG